MRTCTGRRRPRCSASTPRTSTATTRDRAKAVNFGIVYGISDFGLSEQLNIPRADAKVYIDLYLARYPKVRSFIDTTIANAAQEGFVTTLLGRRRAIPELGGATVQQRQLGERLAVNTVIQGTAADIIKVAMVSAHQALADEGLSARLILQIHDELLLEAPVDEAERAARGGARRHGQRLRARSAPRRGHRHRRDMARREELGGDDPYRELQVHRDACPEVIDAAFAVLREMVLRSEDDEAPRRLARLMAAHRTLSDPARRAAWDADVTG